VAAFQSIYEAELKYKTYHPLPPMTWYTLSLNPPFLARNAESDPGATTFLQQLFMNAYEVDVRNCNTIEETEDEFTLEIHGRCGTDERGYIWNRYEYLDDRSEYVVTILSYGLPDLELQWSYYMMKSGYVYRFCHRHLKVWFQNDSIRQQFVDIWKQVFEFEPILSPDST
jgi:hypothetical protein